MPDGDVEEEQFACHPDFGLLQVGSQIQVTVAFAPLVDRQFQKRISGGFRVAEIPKVIQLTAGYVEEGFMSVEMKSTTELKREHILKMVRCSWISFRIVVDFVYRTQ